MAQVLRSNIIKAKQTENLQGISELEVQLENIQDRYERFRNQLEDLKRLKLPIHPILTKWKMLEQILEHYREALDDAIMKLL